MRVRALAISIAALSSAAAYGQNVGSAQAYSSLGLGSGSGSDVTLQYDGVPHNFGYLGPNNWGSGDFGFGNFSDVTSTDPNSANHAASSGTSTAWPSPGGSLDINEEFSWDYFTLTNSGTSDETASLAYNVWAQSVESTTDPGFADGNGEAYIFYSTSSDPSFGSATTLADVFTESQSGIGTLTTWIDPNGNFNSDQSGFHQLQGSYALDLTPGESLTFVVGEYSYHDAEVDPPTPSPAAILPFGLGVLGLLTRRRRLAA